MGYALDTLVCESLRLEEFLVRADALSLDRIL